MDCGHRCAHAQSVGLLLASRVIPNICRSIMPHLIQQRGQFCGDGSIVAVLGAGGGYLQLLAGIMVSCGRTRLRHQLRHGGTALRRLRHQRLGTCLRLLCRGQRCA